MIHETDKKLDNSFALFEPCPDDFVICKKDSEILLSLQNEEIVYPRVNEAEKVGEYLFSVGDKKYFIGEVREEFPFSFHNMRALRGKGFKNEVFAGITALHLINWYENTLYCGRCGSLLCNSKTERARVCDCGNIIYPTICPAVIVAVISGDRICMTKYNRGYANWALVAGYTEIGETVEQTVCREVMEEIGLKVNNVRYYKSQPWGLSSSLLLGFFCEVDGSDELRVDNIELKEAKWFTKDEIDFRNDDFSLTREMIEAFRTGNYPK